MGKDWEKLWLRWLPWGVVLSLLLVLGRPALAAQDPWPKRFENPKGTVVMYQPQLEDFKDDILTARAVRISSLKSSTCGWYMTTVPLGCSKRLGHGSWAARAGRPRTRSKDSTTPQGNHLNQSFSQSFPIVQASSAKRAGKEKSPGSVSRTVAISSFP